MIDFSTAAEIGKMLGVEAIVVGTVADMGNSVDLRARLVDVEKGVAITATQVDVVKDPTIAKILSNGRRPAIYGKAISKPTKEGEAVSGELPKVTVRNLSIEMIECKRYREGVNCILMITNNEQDRNIDVYYYGNRCKSHPCRFFDNNGNAYLASTIKMANKSYSFDYFQTFGSKYGSLLFISGVPVKVVYYIADELLSTANSLSLFEFWLAESVTNFKIQFRDIPIIE
jgi:hypothetical protein